MRLLQELAKASDMRTKIDNMFGTRRPPSDCASEPAGGVHVYVLVEIRAFRPPRGLTRPRFPSSWLPALPQAGSTSTPRRTALCSTSPPARRATRRGPETHRLCDTESRAEASLRKQRDSCAPAGSRASLFRDDTASAPAPARRQKIVVDGKDVVPDVHAVLDKIKAFSDKARGNQQPLFFCRASSAQQPGARDLLSPDPSSPSRRCAAASGWAPPASP